MTPNVCVTRAPLPRSLRSGPTDEAPAEPLDVVGLDRTQNLSVHLVDARLTQRGDQLHHVLQDHLLVEGGPEQCPRTQNRIEQGRRKRT